jgi:hypothetical protein
MDGCQSVARILKNYQPGITNAQYSTREPIGCASQTLNELEISMAVATSLFLCCQQCVHIYLLMTILIMDMIREMIQVGLSYQT